MFKEMLIVLTWAVVVGVVTAAAGAAPYQSENWNTQNPLNLNPYPQVPHANGENLWAYWDETFIPVDDGQPWVGGNYHNKPMKWSPTGGVGDTGYAWAPLTGLNTEHNETGAHWPAYLTDQITTYYDHYYGVPPREVDLTADTHITVSLLDRQLVSTSATPPGPVDLAGGKVYFFVGHWWHNNLADPNDDAYIFFYNNNGSFDVGTDWTTSYVEVGVGTALAGDWPVIASSQGLPGYTDPPTTGDEAYEHFVSPQQWGFVICNPSATVTPNISGELGFDNFAIIPEPGVVMLALMGGIAFMRRR